MGDRALVVFVGSNKDLKGKVTWNVSPTAYLHWDGSQVPEYLAELKTLMGGRYGDIDYALARFIGIVHSTMPDQNLSLGCFETPKEVHTAIKRFMSGNKTPMVATNWDYSVRPPKPVKVRKVPKAVIEDYSHGDAGVVIVDTTDFSWRALGGYLGEHKRAD